MPHHRPRPRAAIDTWVIPLGDGWDPHMDGLTGRVVCGNQTLSLVDPGLRTVKVVALTPSRLLRWLTPDRLIWQRSTGADTAELWTCPAYDISSVSIAALDAHTVAGNTFAASMGRWASWLSKGLRLAAGTVELAAPLMADVYECQMAGDWLVTSRDVGGLAVVWLKWTGTEWIVVSESGPLPQYPQCWLNPSGIVGVGYYGLAGVIAPGMVAATSVNCAPGRPEGIPRLIDVDDVRYVVTASETPEGAPVLYARTLDVALDAVRRTEEIQTIPLPFGWTQFDGRGHDGRLELAGCDAAGHLAWLSVNLAALPVGPVTPSPPEPVPIPIPPEPVAAPKVTITSYDDMGTAPMRCHATYATEAGSGPVVSVTWQFSTDQQQTWIRDATNPADDPDHTYHFTQPGTKYLRLEASGPGGTATTGAERKVTVMADETTPPVPMVETSAFKLASGFLLCADQHVGNVVNATREGDPGAWESFIVEGHPLGGAWIALRADTGYVCIQPTGHQLSATGTEATALPLRLIEIADGTVALMASDGYYLWAENGGGGIVLRNGNRIDAWSSFALFPGVPKEEEPPEPEHVVGEKPSRAAALKWRSEFLAAPGYEWAFMGPGWDRPKLQAYINWAKPRGQFHLPWSAWASYPNSGSPTFDYSGSKWPQFLELVDWVQAQGMIVAFFCITDQVWGGSGFTEQWAHDWIKAHVPDLVPRVRLYVNGWEFPQINGGYPNWWTWNGDANHRILKTIRQVVGPDNLVFCHFPPERITGWPHFQHEGGGGEPDWWRVAGSNLDGILWQDDPRKDEALVISDCIGGPSVGGSHDVGDMHRIMGSPSTWGLHGKVLIPFEYSRNVERGERLSRAFFKEPKTMGCGNMGKWGGP